MAEFTDPTSSSQIFVAMIAHSAELCTAIDTRNSLGHVMWTSKNKEPTTKRGREGMEAVETSSSEVDVVITAKKL